MSSVLAPAISSACVESASAMASSSSFLASVLDYASRPCARRAASPFAQTAANASAPTAPCSVCGFVIVSYHGANAPFPVHGPFRR